MVRNCFMAGEALCIFFVNRRERAEKFAVLNFHGGERLLADFPA